MTACGTKRTCRKVYPFVRFWSEADMARSIVLIISAAFDPKRTLSSPVSVETVRAGRYQPRGCRTAYSAKPTLQ
jgi:hypothetical protein